MPATSYAQWTWHIREGIERCLDEYVNGPWDDVVDVLAKTISDGAITVDMAARLNRALAETLGQASARCEVCECPAPGVAHGH